MSCTKFHENRLIIDGEIDEKHALQIIVSCTLKKTDVNFQLFEIVSSYRNQKLQVVKNYAYLLNLIPNMYRF